jgi:hypothetical protein
MNKAEVCGVLALLSEVYPGRIGSGQLEQTAAVWTAVLADAEGKQVLASAVAWMRDAKPHPPTPGELLDLLTVIDRDTPEEAWGLVRQEIQRAGHTRQPKLPDLALRAITAVGGDWGMMCRSLLTSEMTSLRARFLDAYKGMEVRSTKRLALAEADQLAAIAAPLVNRYRIEGETGR